MTLCPIRCFSCGNVIGHLWLRYCELRVKYGDEIDGKSTKLVKIHDGMLKQRTPECQALDELGLTDMCCRRMFLSQVDLIDSIN